MSTQKIPQETRITSARRPRVRRTPSVFMSSAMLLGAAMAAMPAIAAAQSTLGVPFLGRNHLSFYATELSDDGIGAASSALYGGRYARLFGSDDATTRFSFMVQGAGRALAAPDDGVIDLSATAAWTRRMGELTPDLSVTAAVGASVLGWGAADGESGIARISYPVTAGVAYDVRIGSATFTPFAAPGIARYATREHRESGELLVGRHSGWDARLTSGASLAFRDIVLTAGGIRGEEGLTKTSRWTFAAGISF